MRIKLGENKTRNVDAEFVTSGLCPDRGSHCAAIAQAAMIGTASVEQMRAARCRTMPMNLQRLKAGEELLRGSFGRDVVCAHAVWLAPDASPDAQTEKRKQHTTCHAHQQGTGRKCWTSPMHDAPVLPCTKRLTLHCVHSAKQPKQQRQSCSKIGWMLVASAGDGNVCAASCMHSGKAMAM
jgi:hypothetical protein